MANLTNLNNKFLVTTGGAVLINQTSTVSTHLLTLNGRMGGPTFSDSYLQFTGGNLLLKANDDVKLGYNQNVVVKQSSSVGIGTTSPATKLQVVHAGEVIVRSSMTAADGYRGGFEADNQHTGGTIWSMFSTNNSDGYFGGGKFVIANESMGGVDANTTGKFIIDGSGNVTIDNTVSGDATLTLATTTGGDPAIIMNSDAANRSGLIKYQDAGTNIGRIEYVHNGDRLAFQAGSATGETLSVINGAVGIGTTSPGATLDVSGSSAVIWVNPPAGNHAGVNFRQGGTFKGWVGFNNSTGCVNLGRDGSIAAGINVDSNNNVGIGTTTPNEKLVVGTTGGTQNIEISNSYIQSFNRSGSAGYATLDFYSSTYTFNVGPAKFLSYASFESTGSAYARFKHSTGGLNYVGSSESLSSGFGDENDMLNYSVSGKWGVYTNSAFGMVIDESQNVGIGATAPTYRLEVHDDNEDILKLHNTTDGLDSLVTFTNPGGTLGRIQGLDNGGLQFDTGNNAGGLNTNVIYMSNDGRVGINTDSPDEKLDITGGYLKFNGGDYGLKGSASLSYNATSDHYFQSGGSTKVIFKASGNVGIGITTPQAMLQVNGAVNTFSAHFGGQNNSAGQFQGISLGYAEDANAAYRKVAIVAQAKGDGAARQDLHFLVDTVADSNSAGIADSKMNIQYNTGDVIINKNLGIGKTNPSTHLDVQGVITAGDSTTDGAIRRQHQTFATMKPGPSSGSGVDMLFVDHTHTLDITVVAIINHTNVATGRGYSVAAYGTATAGLTQTNFAGNISALSISYVNTGGSENYVLRVTCTYSGVTAPEICVTATGQSASELRAAT